jgi:hypothetical protein
MKSAVGKEPVMKTKLRTGTDEEVHVEDLCDENGAALSKQKTHSANPGQIRQRAFEIHKVRGGGHGYALDDWLQAEREFLAEQEHPVELCDPAADCGWQNLAGATSPQ